MHKTLFFAIMLLLFNSFKCETDEQKIIDQQIKEVDIFVINNLFIDTLEDTRFHKGRYTYDSLVLKKIILNLSKSKAIPDEIDTIIFTTNNGENIATINQVLLSNVKNGKPTSPTLCSHIDVKKCTINSLIVNIYRKSGKSVVKKPYTKDSGKVVIIKNTTIKIAFLEKPSNVIPDEKIKKVKYKKELAKEEVKTATRMVAEKLKQSPNHAIAQVKSTLTDIQYDLSKLDAYIEKVVSNMDLPALEAIEVRIDEIIQSLSSIKSEVIRKNNEIELRNTVYFESGEYEIEGKEISNFINKNIKTNFIESKKSYSDIEIKVQITGYADEQAVKPTLEFKILKKLNQQPQSYDSNIAKRKDLNQKLSLLRAKEVNIIIENKLNNMVNELYPDLVIPISYAVEGKGEELPHGCQRRDADDQRRRKTEISVVIFKPYRKNLD